MQKKLPNDSFWYDENVVLLIAHVHTHIKKVHKFYLPKIYVNVDDIHSKKQWRNNNERFYFQILSWG